MQTKMIPLTMEGCQTITDLTQVSGFAQLAKKH